MPNEPPNAQAPNIRQLALDQIDQRMPEFKKPSSFTQWLGAQMAVALLGVITCVSLLIWGTWWWERPTFEQVKTLAGATATTKDLLELHRSLRTEHLNEFRTVSELLIASGFLPLFTLTAGYAFGSKHRE
jgi:hypothetical protein